MKTRLIRGLASLALVTTLGVNAQGASIWNVGGNGNNSGNWNTDANWNPNTGFPNSEGVEVAFTQNITGNRTINLSANVTIGSLTAGDPTASPSYNSFVINSNATTTRTLTFDVTSGNATINRSPNSGGGLSIGTTGTNNVNLQLNNPLLITWVSNAGDLRLFGTISGPADDPDNPAIGVTIRSGGSGGDQVRLEGTGATYSYAGDTTLDGGYVGVWTAARLPFGANKGNVNVNNNGPEVSMLGFWAAGTHDINGLNGDGLVVQAGNDGNLLTLRVGNGDANGVFSGGVQVRSDLVAAPGTRRFSFAKTGAGTQVLSGDNFYNGTTTVSGGTLLVDGKHETVTGGDANAVPGLYTVDSGATLGGKGEIEPSVDLSGILSPGGSLVLNSFVHTRDTLTLGGLTLQDGASAFFELDPADPNSADNDLVDILGILTGTGGTVTIGVEAFGGGLLAGENTWTLASYGSLAGTLPSFVVNGVDPGYNYSVYLTNELGGPGDVLLTLTAIPEPSTMILLASTLVGLGWTVRRKRQ